MSATLQCGSRIVCRSVRVAAKRVLRVPIAGFYRRVDDVVAHRSGARLDAIENAALAGARERDDRLQALEGRIQSMTDRLNGHESFLAVIPPLRDEVQMRALDVATSQRTATMERAALDLRLRVVEGRG